MLKINPEFRDLIPPLTAEERINLEKNLRAYGCTDPIVAWSQGNIILDGHNRFEICERLGIPYNTIILDDLEDEIEAKYWIFTRQFARRNLNNYQRAELATKLEPVFAELARKNLEQSAKQTNEKKNAKITGSQNSVNPSIEKIDTQKELAKAAQVSHDTIAKVKEIQKEATEEVKQALRDGKTTIHNEFKKIKEKKKNSKPTKPSLGPSPKELEKQQDKLIGKIAKQIELLRSEITYCRTSFGLSEKNKSDLVDDISDILDMLRE